MWWFRCLLKVLDNIQNVENVDLRLLAETFLTHSLLRNDIVRILNPILLKLLSPTTVRISIQNINIQDTDFQVNLEQPDSQKIDEAQARRVYAVSNVNGNVMYHVTDDPDPKPLKKKWYMFNRNNKKLPQAVNTMSSLTDSASVVTKKSKDFKNYDLQMNVERNGKNQVKILFIYPLTMSIYKRVCEMYACACLNVCVNMYACACLNVCMLVCACLCVYYLILSLFCIILIKNYLLKINQFYNVMSNMQQYINF